MHPSQVGLVYVHMNDLDISRDELPPNQSNTSSDIEQSLGDLGDGDGDVDQYQAHAHHR